MSAVEAGIRQIDGVTVPVAGRWRIDPGHAEVAFVGRHFMLTKVRGRFKGVSGVITVAEVLTESSVEVDLAVRSLDSGDATRDEHLLSSDLFDAANFPLISFRSTEVRVVGATGTMRGVLTIRDVAREVTLEITYVGSVRDPWGNDRAVFSAVGKLHREAWGLNWNMVLESGGLLVSKEIDIEIELEATREG